jgi:predicted XRE-type DNA-binding protein
VSSLKKVPAVFFRTAAGREPVRDWLKTLAVPDRKAIGDGAAARRRASRDPNAASQSEHRSGDLLCEQSRISRVAARLHQEDAKIARRGSCLGKDQPQPILGGRSMKRKSTKTNPHHGSSFETFLDEEGYLEQATAKAIKRVMAWQLQQAMKKRKVSKAALAKRLKTSRSQLDRILDPANDQVSLASLVRTAHAVGQRVRFELEEAA